MILLIVANAIYFAGARWWWESPRREAYELPVIERAEFENLGLELLGDPVYGLNSWDQSADVRLYRVYDEPVEAAEFCQMLGPIAEPEAADDLRDHLLNDEVSARRDDVLVTSIVGYLVSLGPFAHPEEALATHRKLDEQALDNFVFSDADQRNGISLGFFSTRLAAENQAASISKYGYEPGIQEREQMAREHWVFVGEGGELPPGYWADLQGSYPLLTLRRGFCQLYQGLVSPS
jgi:hypothetical protein